MKDFYAEIQIKYNITEQMTGMFNILQNTYDTFVNYCQIYIDEIKDYDDILILYTYLDSSSSDIRRLNDYLRGNEVNIDKIRNVFNFTNNKFKYKNNSKYRKKNIETKSAIRKLNSNNRFNNEKINSNSFKKTSSEKSFSHSKIKKVKN